MAGHKLASSKSAFLSDLLARAQIAANEATWLDPKFQVHRLVKDIEEPIPSTLAINLKPRTTPQAKSRYRDDFEELELLGKGGFGAVWKVRDKNDGRIYAVKKVNISADPHSRDVKLMQRELRALSSLQHSNIVRYYHSWTDESEESGKDSSDSEDATAMSGQTGSSSANANFDYHSSPVGLQDVASLAASDETGSSSPKSKRQKILYIKMEHCSNTLQSLIRNYPTPKTPPARRILREEAWRLVIQIAEGLAYMHSKGLIHRDLKPANVFLDKNNNVKIGDFGLTVSSSKVHENSLSGSTQASASELSFTTNVGTASYMAPEIGTGKYDKQVDIYSLGLIYFELLYPFSTKMERSEVFKNLRHPAVHLPPGFADSPEVDIIRGMLSHDPAERPSTEYILLSDLEMPENSFDQDYTEFVKTLEAEPPTVRSTSVTIRLLGKKEWEVKLGPYPLTTTLAQLKENLPPGDLALPLKWWAFRSVKFGRVNTTRWFLDASTIGQCLADLADLRNGPPPPELFLQLQPLLRFQRLDIIKQLAESESWGPNDIVLINYLTEVFRIASVEGHLETLTSESRTTVYAFNTLLASHNSESIWCLFRPESGGSLQFVSWLAFDMLLNSPYRGLTSPPKRKNWYLNHADIMFDPTKVDLSPTHPPDYGLILSKNIAYFNTIPGWGLQPAQGQLERFKTVVNAALKKALYKPTNVVPVYFPVKGTFQMLLPLFFEPNKPSLALVLALAPDATSYTIASVLPLETAYNNARILGQLHSSWLLPPVDQGAKFSPGDLHRSDPAASPASQSTNWRAGSSWSTGTDINTKITAQQARSPAANYSQSAQLHHRYRKDPCKYHFGRGGCRNGESCTFSHTTPPQ